MSERLSADLRRATVELEQVEAAIRLQKGRASRSGRPPNLDAGRRLLRLKIDTSAAECRAPTAWRWPSSNARSMCPSHATALRKRKPVERGEHKPPCCRDGVWTFAGADFEHRATKWRCPTGECRPASVWVKASTLHPLILARASTAASSTGVVAQSSESFGRLERERAMLPRRVERARAGAARAACRARAPARRSDDLGETRLSARLRACTCACDVGRKRPTYWRRPRTMVYIPRGDAGPGSKSPSNG
jgi:hypothetical protein